MKKLLSSILAATMVAGMSVSAFAVARKAADQSIAASKDDAYTLENKVYTEDKDGNMKGYATLDTVGGGDSLYYPILVDGDEMDKEDGIYYYVDKFSDVDDLRVKLDDTYGGKYIDGDAKIVRKELPVKPGFTKDDSISNEKVTGKYLKAGAVKVTIAAGSDDTHKKFSIGSEDPIEFPKTDENYVVTLGNETNIVEFTIAASDATVGEKSIGSVALSNDKVYCVEVNVDDYYGEEETELEYELSLRTRKSQYDSEDESNNAPMSFTLGADADDALEDRQADTDGLKKVKFNDDGELELTINKDTKSVKLDEAVAKDDKTYDIENIFLDGEKIDFTYDVKASNQDNLFLGINDDSNKDIIVNNPKADVYFVNFDGKPEFDFTGTAKFTVDDGDKDWYFYEIEDGKAVETNAKYDADDECFVLRTRTLGSYVISDRELEAKEVKEEKPAEKPVEKPADKTETTKPADKTTTPSKTVPTGAIA